MGNGYVTKDLLVSAIEVLSEWTTKVPKQYSRHVWSILPPKISGANCDQPIDYEESDDFQFMDRFQRLRGGTHPYFDPFTRAWLPEGYPHSNLATFRKKTFVRSWQAASWNGSVLELAPDYGTTFEKKVLTKSGQITRIPALALAIWLFKRPSVEWPNSSSVSAGLPSDPTDLIKQLKAALKFQDDNAWDLIFDLSIGTVENYREEISSHSPEMELEDIRATCEEMALPAGGVAAIASATDLLSTDISSAPRVANVNDIQDELEFGRLTFPESLIRRVAAALTHSHVRLIGPPGTGKTTLAKAILQSVVGENYSFTVATGQWTSEDLVGGPVPNPDEPTKLVFQPGIVLQAANEGRWIGIDEINRADIDSAFGELFGLLAGFDIDLPYFAPGGQGRRIKVHAERPAGELPEGEYGVPKSWRMIATMNSWDKVSLNRVSFAFSRRWCTVFVPVPSASEYNEVLEAILDDHPDVRGNGLDEALHYLFVDEQSTDTPSLRSLGMSMGPGIAKSCVRDIEAMLSQGLEPGDAFAQAVDGFVLPQLEGSFELHEALEACLTLALEIAGAPDDLLDQLGVKLATYTGRRASTAF